MLMSGSSTLCQGPQDAWWPSNPVLLQMSLLYLGLLSTICTIYLRLTESENGGGSPGVETVLEEVLLTRAASDLLENSSSSLLVGRIPLPEPPALPLEENKPLPPPAGSSPVSSSSPATASSSPPSSSSPSPSPPSTASSVLANGTAGEADQPHDDIPSFSEWAKKQMAEAEKNKGENLTVGTVKVRMKNYASPDCGAKVIASNPEALSPGAILSPSRDDYMLSACNVKIWFIVELCEAIQPQRIEIANFELFSSSPKEISISVSDRYPTREWSSVSSIIAKDERNIQSFPLPQLSQFAKYFRVELHSHYGAEHFCPVSLFKAFGTSELEVLDNVDNDGNDENVLHSALAGGPSDEDEDFVGLTSHLPSIILDNTETSTMENDSKTGPGGGDGGDSADDGGGGGVPAGGGGNLLGTAKAAVMSIVKKAAEVLVVKGGENNGTCKDSENIVKAAKDVHIKQCITPAYLIVCTNCTDDFYNRVYDYLSCNGPELESMLSNSFIHRMVLNSRLCPDIGLEWGLAVQQQYLNYNQHQQQTGNSVNNHIVSSPNKSRISLKDRFLLAVDYLRTFLYPETVASLCNYLAVSEKKVSRNVSHSVEFKDNPTTPELTTLPTTDDQEIISSGSSHKIHEPQSATSTKDAVIINNIAPTKTLPPVKEEMSLETNETRKSSKDSRQISAENFTKTSDPSEVSTKTIPTPTVSVTTASSTLSRQEAQTPLITDSVEELSDLNETERLEISAPLVPPPAPSSTAQVQDEVVDSLTLASLFPELDEEGGTTEPATAKTTSQQQPPTQKESVFVRLANRIKALEVNMSLSGQYLEELSRRYKKQVEELQRTLANMVEERRLASERESIQAAHISSLTVKVDALTLALSEVIAEREKVSMIGQHGVIIVVEVVVFLVVLAVCRWLGGSKSSSPPNSENKMVSSPQQHLTRRHSVDNVATSVPKMRRPSEEACVPAGTTHKELLVDGVKRKTSREGARRRKRRRKDRWDDEDLAIITAANGEEENWIPSTTGAAVAIRQPDYAVKTALWSRSKRTSHTQTSSSQETLCSILTQNNSSSTTSTTTNTNSTSTSLNVKSKKAGGSGGAIKKIVKKFF